MRTSVGECHRFRQAQTGCVPSRPSVSRIVVAEGRSDMLLVAGEPGAGRTALLEAARMRAHQPADDPFESARTQALFGSRLRRTGHRVVALRHLEAPRVAFDAMGGAAGGERSVQPRGRRLAVPQPDDDRAPPRPGGSPASRPTAPTPSGTRARRSSTGWSSTSGARCRCSTPCSSASSRWTHVVTSSGSEPGVEISSPSWTSRTRAAPASSPQNRTATYGTCRSLSAVRRWMPNVQPGLEETIASGARYEQ